MTTIDHREKEVLSVDRDAGDAPDFTDASEHPRLRIPFRSRSMDAPTKASLFRWWAHE